MDRCLINLVVLTIFFMGISQDGASAGTKTAGKATIYSKSFEGKKTATGETFCNQKISAASNKFPLGSKVLVKNKATGRSAVVKINDRMAIAAKAPVDLSKAAANKLGVKGTAPVEATLVK